MAKRSRKLDTTPNTKSAKQPRTTKQQTTPTKTAKTKANQTKTKPEKKNSKQLTEITKINKKTTAEKGIAQKTKSETKPKKKKDETSKANINKIKTTNNKKTFNNKIQQKTQPNVSKTPVKRGRKPKIKKLSPEKEIEEIKRQIDDDDETEEDEIIEKNTKMFQKEISPKSITDQMETDQKERLMPSRMDISYEFDNDFKTSQKSSSVAKPSSSSSFEFDEKQNYMSTLYNSNSSLLSSSSTSAFSVPSQPKFNANHLLPHHSMMANETNPLTTMITSTSAPMPSVKMAAPPPPQPVVNTAHQSLLSPPPQHQNSNTANDPVHDLPQELLQQGWRKFWSRREGRPYFFNKVTNQSVWDMPKLSSLYDPLTDPLGIQSSNTQFQTHPTTPTDPETPPIYPTFNPSLVSFIQNKNTDNVGNSNDKKTLIGPYDFDIESNSYIWEGLIFFYFHPHPETENLRFNFVQKLRQNYWELCHSRQNIDPPKDSFTKWILERKIIDKGYDPYLPSECTTELSNYLYMEIMNDIPIKLTKPKFSGEARKQLSKYAEAAKKIIDSPNVSAMSRKIVKWNVEDAFEWIRQTLNATYEDYTERLEHLKKQCQPHIIEAAKSTVESICLKIFHVATEYARRIRELNLELFRKEDLRERSPNIRFPNQKKVICYPAYLINPCPKLPPVHMYTEKDVTFLRYKSEILRLNTSHFQKLELLYYFNCRDDRKYNFFLTRVWCLLRRYQSFYDKTEGISFQNSLPLSVFGALNKHFGVTFECFSSPLNTYFRQYCSFFPDTDGYFGSRGSILNFYPMSGSFQANPPESEELIDASITHFEKLLENAMGPLSFIIFIQEKPEISQKIISRLESNKFKRMNLSIPALEHEYRHGFQHIYNKNDVLAKSPYNTLIYFLQNGDGFLKWGPTPERVEELVESFKIGRDKELNILSPTTTLANNQNNPKLPETEIRPNGNEN